jgi:hypothetical protein
MMHIVWKSSPSATGGIPSAVRRYR